MDFFSFEGRIGRGQWWGLGILLTVLAVLATVVSFVIFPPLVFFVYVAVLVASLSINSRRCHDLGWSGWLQLVMLVPFIGGLFMWGALGFVPGQSGPNKFGYPGGQTVPPTYESYPPHLYPSTQSQYQPSTQQPVQSPSQSMGTGFQPDLVHPSLREANQRAWQSSQN